MWIGLLIFNLIIIYPSLVLEVWIIDASHDWRWWRIQSSHPFRFASFPVKALRPDPTMDGLEFAARPNASDSERTRLLKQVHSFHKQQAQKESLLNACKHSEGKSHRKPLVGWLLMLTPYEILFLAKGDPHEWLMVQVLISSSRLQRELRIAMGTPAATASRFSPPNSGPSKSKDCQQRRCKDR